MADVFVTSSRLPALVSALRSASGDVAPLLLSFAEQPGAGELRSERKWMYAAYAENSLEAIRRNLARQPEEAARAALQALDPNSPTALKVTLRALRQARELESLDQCLASEFKVATACLAGHDLSEGIRAAVIDKDRTPRWHPARLEDVSAEMIDAHFRPVAYH